MTHDLANLVRRTNLVEAIEVRAKQPSGGGSWSNHDNFKTVIEGLKPYVDNFQPCVPSNAHWKEDDALIKLAEEVNREIIKQLLEGEKNIMEITTTKLAAAAGVLSLVAIALYAYRCQKNKAATNDDSVSKNLLENVEEKRKKFVGEVKAGCQPHQKLSPQPAPVQQPKTPVSPVYSQNILLLIVQAKDVDKTLKQGSVISKKDAEKIISNAMMGYCFAENNPKGQQVLKAVECSDEDINYESADRVFLQLSLSAKPEIIVGKRDKLGLREAMHPTQTVTIQTLKKLQTTHSIKTFYSI